VAISEILGEEDKTLGPIGFPELLAIGFAMMFGGILVLLPFWMIFSKAGFSGWMSLTQLIPIVNVVALFYLAFAEWPVHRELHRPGVPQ
jgi:hypothetical protein